MYKYLVFLTDELGEEFSVEILTYGFQEAWGAVQADYPESTVVFVQQLKPYIREI